MDQNSVLDLINGNVYGIWYLVGAALVFFMQCGFAMVEAGFTRAKNAGNIIMKNLMDFCLGTVVFILIGFGILCGEDLAGIIGKPGFDIFSDYANFDWSSFVFNLVFCATAATIVSGAMAERTKFISYCIYSAVISAVIYPVETHWVWGGGWLSQLSTPFHDFAGSGVIHMVGGVSALIGAAILGPRIGKFTKTKDGKVNAIPGHSLTIGALGVFILWFGWYGFNGAAATSVPQLGTIFLTTTIAPALATVSCMIFTWIKYGKPDVSMCLNASLAGLVAITAGCDVVDAFGSAIIGIISGLLVCFGVWFLDHVLHVDDLWRRLHRSGRTGTGRCLHSGLDCCNHRTHILYHQEDHRSACFCRGRSSWSGRNRAQPALRLCRLYAVYRCYGIGCCGRSCYWCHHSGVGADHEAGKRRKGKDDQAGCDVQSGQTGCIAGNPVLYGRERCHRNSCHGLWLAEGQRVLLSWR